MRKVILLLVAWASLSSAQDSSVDPTLTDEQVEPVRRYTVEIVVFAYTEDASVGSEIFIPDEPPPQELLFDEDGNPLPLDEEGNPILPEDDEVPEFGDTIVVDEELDEESEEEEDAPLTWIIVPEFEDSVDAVEIPLAAPPPTTPDGEEDEVDNPFQLVLMTEADYSLLDVVEKFELLDAYETLMHFGWTQPAFPEEGTPPIELQLFAEPPEGLNGTLTLYLSRYLHLVVDVALDAPAEFEEEVVDEEDFFSFGDRRTGFGYEPEQPVMPVRFRIQEDRIVKNGELRYFDHPKFGVLAKVTRVEEPEREETDGEGSVLASGLVQ